MKTPHLRLLTPVTLLVGLIAAAPVSAADLLVGPGQTYTTIQAAVDAAISGDSIIIDPGTYPEQVLVDAKDLTLTGAGQGLTVIAAPDTLQIFYTTTADHYPVLGVRDATVAVSDLTVDGAGKGALNEQFYGLLLRNAGGSATAVEITGVRNEPLDGVAHGVALAVDNDDATARTLDVAGCTFLDYQKNAASIFTAAGTVLTLTMTGNETVGAGPTSVIVQNGIEITGGDVAVTLDTNTVRDVAWLGGGSTATGILISNATGTATGNILSGCQSGLHLNAAAVGASSNDITVPRPTDFGYGVIIDNTDPAYAKALSSPMRAPSPFRGDWERRAGKATLAMSVTGNTIALDPAVDDPTGTIGLRAANSQGYDDLDVTVTGNTFVGFDVATAAVETAPTTGIWLAAEYGTNTFQACGTGLFSDLAITVAAESCWWAAVDGPGGDGPGAGSLVTGLVDFDPWVTDYENVFCLPDTLQVTEVALSDTTVFDYTGGASGRINGFSIDVTWDPAVATAVASDFSRPPSGAFSTASIFIAQDVAPGQVRIDAAIGGSVPGIYAGSLFTGIFGFEPTATDGATSTVDIIVNSIRDHFNQPLAGLVHVPGTIQVDSKPVFLGVAVTDTTLASTEWTGDGHDLMVEAILVESSLDSLRCDLAAFGGPLLELADATVDGDTYTWYFAGTSGTGDGPIDAVVTGVDTQAATASDAGTITADNTPPAGLSGLTVSPGHAKLNLAWTAPAPDAGSPMAGVEFRYNTWGGYPSYSGLLPDPPADVTQGTDTGAGLQTETELAWLIAPRDVYVMAGFVRDFVGNASPLGDSGAATNYWLGDTDSDGYVDVSGDVTALGNTYGLATGEPGYDPVCDVGPTDTWSPRGIPMPELDGYQVQFEDLMIFALNLGEVDPSRKFAPGDVPDLHWEQLDRTTYALVLKSACGGLQGVNLRADLPASVSARITAGSMLDDQESPIFLRDAGTRDLDVGLAAIGSGETISGHGELMRVELTKAVSNLTVTVSARDQGNRELLVDVADDGGAPAAVPARHRLDQNYPNPFNPQTTIAFALPVATRTHVAIYTVNGQLVRTLLSLDLAAGEHTVTWYGRDDTGRRVATGTYFYQLRAGDFRQVRKLTLVK